MKADPRRIRNALHGLALGEALSWPVMYQQASLLPYWTRRLRRDIESENDLKNILTLPVAFSLNQDRNVFKLSPASNTEWAALIMDLLCHQPKIQFQNISDFWKKLAEQQETIHASIGIKSALRNIRKGLEAPVCGHDQPHYFDDSAIMRVIPFGIRYADEPELNGLLTEYDASWTNAREGVLAAKALSAGVGLAVLGGTSGEILESMRNMIRGSDWLFRTAEKAWTICGQYNDFFDAVPVLNDELLIYEYSFANSSVELMAVFIAIISKPAQSVQEMISQALHFPRLSATLPALCGTFAGAMHPEWKLQGSWLNSIKKLRGITIPQMIGFDYLNLVEKFIAESAGATDADQ
jgi:ADP-ribosylglycohydrolase